MDGVAAHELALTEYALDMLPREVPGFTLMGSPEPVVRAGIVTFTLPGVHAHDMASLLDRVAVAIRAGHHCTQPLHERLGLAATARASFNVYTDRDHLDRLAAGLRDVMRVFGVAGAQHVVGDMPAGDERATPMADALRDAIPAAPVSAGGPS